MNRPHRHATLCDLMDRMRKSRGGRLLLLCAGASALGLLCLAGLLYLRHGSLPFLPAYPGAEWVLYPKPIEGTRHEAVPLTATFQRRFVLDTAPAQAQLTLRAFGQASLSVNGQPARDIPRSAPHTPHSLTVSLHSSPKLRRRFQANLLPD